MLQPRQETAAAGALDARFSLRKFLPHLVFGLGSVALAGAVLLADASTRTFALSMIGVAWLVAVVGVGLVGRKLGLVVDHAGIGCPGDALFVPWTDVVALVLTASAGGDGALRIEVRNGRELLTRQSPDLSLWRGRRTKLAEQGALECPLGALDRSADEIFETAVDRFRAAGRDEIEVIDSASARVARRVPDGARSRQTLAPPAVRAETGVGASSGLDRRMSRKRRLVLALTATMFLLQLIFVVRLLVL